MIDIEVSVLFYNMIYRIWHVYSESSRTYHPLLFATRPKIVVQDRRFPVKNKQNLATIFNNKQDIIEMLTISKDSA